MNPQFPAFKKIITHPVRFAFFKLIKLPAAFIAGLRVGYIDEKQTVILVKHGWLNQNPFKSMYFAVQAMAAEMYTFSAHLKWMPVILLGFFGSIGTHFLINGSYF